MIEPIHDDVQFENYIAETVEVTEDGWYVTSTLGMGFFCPDTRCSVAPVPGDHIRLYGEGVGSPIRGIVINGRVYQYETSHEHKESQRKLRAQFKAEREAVSARFVASVPSLPPLPVFQCSDPEGWKEMVAINSKDPYSYEIVRYAAAWAALMEQRMAAGEKLTDISSRCSHEADTSGITGFMYGAAVAILSRCWVHGDTLRRAHNLETQISDEGEKANESGGVLNPALLSVGGS